MLSGLPASGKSTFAKEKLATGGDWVRVNKDLLRTMLHADKFNYKNEKVTHQAEVAIVNGMLAMCKNVIIDDTNLGKKHQDVWEAVAYGRGAKFEKKVFNVDYMECIIRNMNRGLKVPTHRIVEMALQYKMIPDMDKPVVIVDLDGTVADLSHRLHFIQHEESTDRDYESFFMNVIDDKPIKSTIDMVEGLYAEGYPITFVSGRSDISRAETEAWLEKYVKVEYKALIMREAGDKRPDTMVKNTFYKRFFQQYDIHCAIDDRPSVIREVWEANGVRVIDVGDGIEF